MTTNNETHGFLATVIKELNTIDEWLSGPAMTDRERLDQEVEQAEAEIERDLQLPLLYS